jgi:pyrroline-5-carboxylate reductase
VSPCTIAIIGGGNMGRALVGGLIRRGVAPDAIRVGEPDETARRALQRDFGCVVAVDNASCVQAADAVVIAVKPQLAAAVLTRIAPQLQAGRALIISIMAGIRIAALQAWCGREVPIVRAMPNRPALVGAGATALYAPPAAPRALAGEILGSVGAVVWLTSEDQLDIVTALSGSGPAYFFRLAELMMQAAVNLGLDCDAARLLAIETLHGAGVLAHASDGDLARLTAEVTSKGGTTAAALRVLDAAPGLAMLVQRAVDAAAQRSGEISREFGAGA